MAAHINADLYSDKSDIASVIAALNNLRNTIQSELPADTILEQIKSDSSIAEAIDILQDVHDEIYEADDDDYQVND